MAAPPIPSPSLQRASDMRPMLAMLARRAARHSQLFRSTVWRFCLPEAAPVPGLAGSAANSMAGSAQAPAGGGKEGRGRTGAGRAMAAPLLPYHKFRASDNVLLSPFREFEDPQGRG